MSICIDDSNVFKYNFLKKLNNQTKKKSSKFGYQLKSKKQYNVSEKIKSPNEKPNEELIWLD